MIDICFQQEQPRSRIHLAQANPASIAQSLRGTHRPLLLVTDAHVARAQTEWLDAFSAQIETNRWIMQAGEDAKNSANLLSLLAEMHRQALPPDGVVLAFGGGMVGDLAGLAASLWKRGLAFYFIPTSLLAMVDASVGGKTAINFGGLRNALGSYWPAKELWLDPGFLSTLPEDEWSSGFGELLKAAWLSEGGWALDLEEQLPELLSAGHPELPRHIERALRFKASLVSEDFRDQGKRRQLNLGHSFAHALEAESEVRLKHGHAVLLGMQAAVEASQRAGLLGEGLARDLRDRLVRVRQHLSVRWPEDCDDTDELLQWMKQDKKLRSGKIRLILLEDLGRPVEGELDDSVLAEVWQETAEICS